MFKVNEIGEDNKTITTIEESYKGEAVDIFEDADIQAGEKVDVCYTIDSKTGEDIELWRKDWL